MPKRHANTKNPVIGKPNFRSMDEGVNLALSALEAHKKTGLLIDLNNPTAAEKFTIARFQTRLLSFNKLLSGRYSGGLPVGRLIDIVGFESVGKTTLTLQIAGDFFNSVDANGNQPRILYVDAEHALDVEYAQTFGIDPFDQKRFFYAQPDTAEDALDLIDAMAKSRAVDLVIVDSVAGLATQEEVDKTMEESTMATLARKLSTFFRRSYKHLANNGITMITINQFRQNMVNGRAMGKTAIGGNAIRFWTSIKLELGKDGGDAAATLYDSNKNPIGTRIKIRSAKNKTYVPNLEITMDLIHGKGFSWSRDMINIAAQHGIIKKAGTWLSYDGKQLGQGPFRASQMLEEDEDLANEIRQKIMELDNE